MSDIDQQFVEYVVKSLVGKPDAVQIERRIDEKGVLLELTVDPEDLGRVIGKRGATAQSLRTLLRALGTKNDARYNLKIIDNGDPEYSRVGGDNNAGSAPIKDQPTGDAGQQDSQTGDTPTDEAKSQEAAQAEPEQPKEAEAPEEIKSDSHEEQTSDRLRQTRAELADLDDLDV